MLADIAAADSIQFSVSGPSGPILDNILIKLNNQQNKKNSTEDIEHLYNTAPRKIKQAIAPFGYFKPNIQAIKLIEIKKGKWQASLNVSIGPATYITKIQINVDGPGKNDPNIQKLLANFPLKVKQIFTTDTYEKARDLLLQTANNQGYLKSIFNQKEVLIDREQATAIINLNLETGPRYYFGQALFNQTAFDPRFLQRFITFKPGQPFSSEKLLKLQQDLSNSHYFQQVSISPNLEKATKFRVPIYINLTLPKAKHYTFGLGYGTLTGPRATFGVDYRRAGNTGQHFSFLTRLSQELSGVSAKYFIPGNDPLTDQYILGAEIQKFSPENGESFSENLSASRVKTWHDWQHTLTINYLIERYKVEENPTESSLLLYPSYSLSWIKTDNLINPTAAKIFNFNLKGASDKILSHNKFVQSAIKVKYIFSPIKDGLVILRGNFGYTIVNDLTKLPLTLRYFAGGINSVRGYKYDDIGPGRYLETASIELQHKIIGNFSGAIFYDVGTATNHFNDFLYRGQGVGLIYHSLIGPIRIYAGRAMSIKGKPVRIEFSIGPDF